MVNKKIEQLIEKQWVVLDDLLSFKESQELFQWIQKNQKQMKPARIGSLEQKNQNTSVRSDSILWIEPGSDLVFSVWNQRIENLTQNLKEELFLPLKNSEFHFARYPEGSFYAKHIDQPKSTHNRLISIVHYLNPEWSPDWGGQIVLHTEEGEVRIQPQSPTTLIFQSHKVEHEVLPTRKDRFSLTGWLLS